MGFFDKLVNGLKKTKDSFIGKIDTMLAGFGRVDEDLFEELEDILISADFGVQTTSDIMAKLRAKVKVEKATNAADIKEYLKTIISGMLFNDKKGLSISDAPVIITVIGVNGVGKTTSIGKMANIYKSAGKKVLLAAADTFRAAAIDQLAIWAERSGSDLIRQSEGSDPAAVVFDACKAANARKADVLICDTAGRLHNKKNLMDELAKISRVINREMPNTNKEVFLVLDATTGQNAVNQAKAFSEITELTGIILTKLDGTSKGGIIVSICNDLKIPVRLVGVGEGIDDMQEFNSDDYVNILFN